MPESSAIATAPVWRAAARALPSALPAKLSASSGAARPPRGAPAVRSSPRPRPPADARTRGACARCGWPAPARGARHAAGPPGPAVLTRPKRDPPEGLCGPLDRPGLDRTQLLDPGAQRAPAARRGGPATGACARPSPAPPPARRRRSSRRSHRPRRWSPRSSRGPAAARPSTMPHEIAATDPVRGDCSSCPSCCRREQASASAT